ncbi:MAG: phytanoyl-CoA dioxygenase family protein [Candidatus Latescibacteria bacterium]|nr:phytanoyl-CoA dioxygenase family protein [Candidatus Latescibacterota bacterium]
MNQTQTQTDPDSPGYTFDNYVASGYAPDLYRCSAVADGIGSFADLTDEGVRRFHEQGYMVVHHAFSEAEVRTALEGLIDLIDGRNPDFKGLEFEVSVRDRLPTMTREEKVDAVRKLVRFVGYDPRLDALSTHPKLLGTLARLMGTPAALFSNQAMLKPPRIGREKPWHQDHAYFNLPMGTCIISAWVALDEAAPENGCMHVIPGSHRDGPVVHFKRRDWQICDTHVDTDRILAVPLKPGGCLLWHGLLHHGSPATLSPKRRRALQLHYVPERTGQITAEERLAVFGSEGKDVTC